MDIFDAVMDGTYEHVLWFYTGDPNIVVKRSSGLSLIELAVLHYKERLYDRPEDRLEDKLKIVSFLLSEGADINYLDTKKKRNALHWLFFSGYHIQLTGLEYVYKMTKLLVESGIDVNCKDIYGRIPLSYAITLGNAPTKKLMPVFEYLVAHGSDVNSKNNFGMSCVDYAKEMKRDGFLDIVREAGYEVE